jgi:carbohydrate-binding DOMON domain-containing protein
MHLTTLSSRIREAKAAQISASDRTTQAIRAIPPPKTTVDVTTNVRVSVTANSITRTMQQTGTFTAAHVGAYNRAGGLLS